MSGGEPLLSVRDLEVAFDTEHGVVEAVDGVSLDLRAGELLAVVGESGCGKSVMAMTLMGLTRAPNASFRGTVRLRGRDLLDAPEQDLQPIRGAEIAMVFQDPMTSLNPVHRIGDQVAEQVRAHEQVSAGAAQARAVELLRRVGIPAAAERARSYPHQLSGGMRQRVMIALAISCGPSILIADEPTTALDVTVQAQILELIGTLREETGTAVLLVTHDLGVVAEVADRVAVMYAGQIVEQAGVEELFENPAHPYTWGLLGSTPRIDGPRRGRLPAIGGAPPSLADRPAGCHFRPRCPHAFEQCGEVPPLAGSGGESGHLDRCWLSEPDRPRLRMVDGSVGLQPPREERADG